MSILGVGCDIIKISRIEKVLQTAPDFISRILTATELKLLRARNFPEASPLKIAYVAKRYAAKEAFAKALGCGISGLCSWHNIEIYTNIQVLQTHCEEEQSLFTLASQRSQVSRSPSIARSDSAPFFAVSTEERYNVRSHLSLSDDGDYAMAYVVLESV